MAQSEIDYYEILGVGRHATDEDIKKAFRKLARDTHPDKNPLDPTAKEKFQNLQQAYDTLKDQLERSKYDEDNPYHGMRNVRATAAAAHAYSYARAAPPPRSSTAARYTSAAGTRPHAAPSWTTSFHTEGFAQQAAGGMPRGTTRTPYEYDPYARDYTSTRKTRQTYSHRPHEFETSTPKPSTENFYDPYGAGVPKKESAYAKTNARHHTAPPKANASGGSSSSSPRAKSPGPRSTTPAAPGGFDLKAYIREKQAKEAAEAAEAEAEQSKRAAEEAEQKEREAQERHEKHRRERQKKAAEMRKQEEERVREERRNEEMRNSGNEAEYPSRRRSARMQWSADGDDEDEFRKVAEQAEKKAEEELKSRHSKHASGTPHRKKSPVKPRPRKAASPTPPTASSWFGDGIRVFDAEPEDGSDRSESDSHKDPSQARIFGNHPGTRTYTPTMFGEAFQQKIQPEQKESTNFRTHTSPPSPAKDAERTSPVQGTTDKTHPSTGFAGFGDGKNPFSPWAFQEAPTPSENPFKEPFNSQFGSKPFIASPRRGSLDPQDTKPQGGIPRPKSQPTHPMASRVPPPSASAAPETQNIRLDESSEKRASLMNGLYHHTFNTLNALFQSSNTSSSPHKKSQSRFGKARMSKPNLRTSSPNDRQNPVQQPSVETDSDSTSSGGSTGSENKTTPQSSDGVEPMDAEYTGLPKPVQPPKQGTANGAAKSHSRKASAGSSLDGLGKSFSVPPLARSPADVGLEGFEEMKDNLPFPSQASSKPPLSADKADKKPPSLDTFNFPTDVPDAKKADTSSSFLGVFPQSPEDEKLEIPSPPKIPVVPKEVTLPSYNKFYSSLGPYIAKWNEFEEQVHKLRGELLKKGMQAPRESSLDAVDIDRYIARVKDKDMVLDNAFRKARDKHMGALERWKEIRKEVVDPALRAAAAYGDGVNRGGLALVVFLVSFFWLSLFIALALVYGGQGVGVHGGGAPRPIIREIIPKLLQYALLRDAYKNVAQFSFGLFMELSRLLLVPPAASEGFAMTSVLMGFFCG